MDDTIRVLHHCTDTRVADATASHLEGASELITVERDTPRRADDSDEASEQISAGGIDCVLAELDAFTEDGFEPCEWIRETDEGIPCVLVVRNGAAVPDEALAAGVTDFVRLTDGSAEYAFLANRIENAVYRFRTAAGADPPPRDSDPSAGDRATEPTTQERGYERELDRYETLLEIIPDSVVVTDLEGNILDVHGYEGWSGHEKDDLVHDHMEFALTPESVERAEEVVADIILSDDRQKATFEMEIETADGRVIPFEDHITVLPPDENGEIPGTMSVLRNITERKERERELQRQNDRLEQFASITSHDLRNPLNVAQGYIEMVDADCDSEHTETVAEALYRMERLIEDTLTWAQQGSTVEERTPLELGELVPESWEAVGTDVGSVELVDPVTIEGDPGRVRRVIENLLRNAVEHGGEDVEVRIGALADGFYVADDGPGIPPEDRDSVFEAGITTAVDGTGFGLAIVDEICDAHGWDVGVTDSESGGARFEITGVERTN